MTTLILRDLEFGPATVNELESLLRIKRRNLRPYLALLHEQRAIHISGWEQRTGPALPVWRPVERKTNPVLHGDMYDEDSSRSQTDEVLPLVE